MPIPKKPMASNVPGSDSGETTDVVQVRVRARGNTTITYEPLTLDETKYAIVILYGADQSGKTHWAFSAPKPIIVLTFDPGNIRRGVARKYAGQDIQIAKFELPKGLVATSELAQVAKVETDRYQATFNDAVMGGHFRTIIMDREDEAWELHRYDEFDGKQGAKAHHYTPLNAGYKAMIKQAEKYKKNLIMIDAEKDEWKNEKPTGRKIKEGFKHLGMLSQLTLQAEVDNRDNFRMNVIRCRDDATKNGEVLTTERLNEVLYERDGIWAVGENGEDDHYWLNWKNTMAYLIGGRPEEWE
jgi:hypothetical protein